MQQYINLKEGFSLIYEEKQKKINILQLALCEIIIAFNWMGVTDFVAILECALRNKLGTKKKHELGGVIVFGEIDEEFEVCIDFIAPDINTVRFDIVQTQQIVSKLNKLLHMANKLHTTENQTY